MLGCEPLARGEHSALRRPVGQFPQGGLCIELPGCSHAGLSGVSGGSEPMVAAPAYKDYTANMPFRRFHGRQFLWQQASWPAQTWKLGPTCRPDPRRMRNVSQCLDSFLGWRMRWRGYVDIAKAMLDVGDEECRSVSSLNVRRALFRRAG